MKKKFEADWVLDHSLWELEDSLEQYLSRRIGVLQPRPLQPPRVMEAWMTKNNEDKWTSRAPPLPVTIKPNNWVKAVQSNRNLITTTSRRPVAWRYFKDVSVAGISAALDARAPLLRRVLWACVLCVCLSLMLAQCYDRISHYAEEPINVNVRVTHNDSLVFPAVTICNKNIFNLTAARDLLVKYGKLKPGAPITEASSAELVGMDKMTPSDVWIALSHKIDILITECWFGRGEKCDNRGKWSQVFTVMGPCYTYILNEENVDAVGSFHNIYLVINETQPIVKPGNEGMRILIHERTESPVLTARTHSMSAELGWGRDLKMELRKMLSTAKTPCVEETNYLQSQCQTDCFQRTILNNTKCRMPYMTGELAANISDCSNPEDYREAVEAVQTLLVSGGWSAISNCSCVQQCEQTTFLMYPEAVAFKKNMIKLRIFYQDLVFEQITEDKAYPVISLLCDIGGTLGLLMGASVLTVCELLEVAWSRVLSTCCRLKDRNPPPREPKPPARLRASKVSGNTIMRRV